jgi:transcriptional regulator with PAS, ATPase and Fis domain
MKEAMLLVERVASSRATVLITGESGTGKEVVAKEIHRLSGRRDASFIGLNCAAIPETLLESELFGHEKGAFTGADSAKPGKFELANGGTLFLDEIGELTSMVQVKLLRVLQEREIERLGATKPTPVDVRLIAATNRDLQEEVATGRFREDLFFRLHVVHLELAPLRDRRADIMPLAKLFLARYSEANGCNVESIHPAVESLFLSYQWPGNVRELENCIERAVVLCAGATVITLDLLPPQMRSAA